MNLLDFKLNVVRTHNYYLTCRAMLTSARLYTPMRGVREFPVIDSGGTRHRACALEFEISAGF
jgi:hypothetical protein